MFRLDLGDSLEFCGAWPSPTIIISDGAYGIGGFPGDPLPHEDLAAWYAPHLAAWARAASAQTTLWFWNTELGWARTHAGIVAAGWDYAGCSVWDKGLGHIAGNVNTKTLRHFPVVTEVCAHYVRRACVGGTPLRDWVAREWARTGLSASEANRACGVAQAASRKYLNPGSQWYKPPGAMLARIAELANLRGNPAGRPYFDLSGTGFDPAAWDALRAKFYCPIGWTNVWKRSTLRGPERIQASGHPNQKPLDLMRLLIESSSDPGDAVWEPFGGVFSASLAAAQAGRRAFGAEVNPEFFRAGARRFREIQGLLTV